MLPTSGNSDLREALDQAVALKTRGEYQERIEALRERFGHSIRILDPGGNYNCFAYAFGLSDHPDFEWLVHKEQTKTVMKSDLVTEALGAVDSHAARFIVPRSCAGETEPDNSCAT